MKELNYWQQFLNTGRIEDYLQFRESQVDDSISKECIVMGDNPYAGLCEANRDSFKNSAYRGIR